MDTNKYVEFTDGFAAGFKNAYKICKVATVNDVLSKVVYMVKQKYPICENGLFTVNEDIHRDIDEIANKIREEYK